VFGKAITNVIMLGALVRTTNLVSMDSLYKGVESVAFRDAALDKNILAAKRGYEETKVYDIKK